MNRDLGDGISLYISNRLRQHAGFPTSVGSDLSGSFWTERKGLSAFAQASKVESKLCQKQDEEAELLYKC